MTVVVRGLERHSREQQRAPRTTYFSSPAAASAAVTALHSVALRVSFFFNFFFVSSIHVLRLLNMRVRVRVRACVCACVRVCV